MIRYARDPIRRSRRIDLVETLINDS